MNLSKEEFYSRKFNAQIKPSRLHRGARQRRGLLAEKLIRKIEKKYKFDPIKHKAKNWEIVVRPTVEIQFYKQVPILLYWRIEAKSLYNNGYVCRSIEIDPSQDIFDKEGHRDAYHKFIHTEGKLGLIHSLYFPNQHKKEATEKLKSEIRHRRQRYKRYKPGGRTVPSYNLERNWLRKIAKRTNLIFPSIQLAEEVLCSGTVTKYPDTPKKVFKADYSNCYQAITEAETPEELEAIFWEETAGDKNTIIIP